MAGAGGTVLGTVEAGGAVDELLSAGGAGSAGSIGAVVDGGTRRGLGRRGLCRDRRDGRCGIGGRGRDRGDRRRGLGVVVAPPAGWSGRRVLS